MKGFYDNPCSWEKYMGSQGILIPLDGYLNVAALLVDVVSLGSLGPLGLVQQIRGSIPLLFCFFCARANKYGYFMIF